jgi:hypothetical protein
MKFNIAGNFIPPLAVHIILKTRNEVKLQLFVNAVYVIRRKLTFYAQVDVLRANCAVIPVL